MTEKILARYKQRIAGLRLVPSDGGCFEVSVDGELIWSKLDKGRFPDETAIVDEVGKRLGS